MISKNFSPLTYKTNWDYVFDVPSAASSLTTPDAVTLAYNAYGSGLIIDFD